MACACPVLHGNSRPMSAKHDVYELTRVILRPERRFFWLILVYAIAISALTLSIPLSVQILIGTVINAALVQQVIVLAIVLLGLLILSGLFMATQFYLMELFERRFFAHVVSQITLRLLHAEPDYMEGINRDELVNRYFDIMTIQKSLPTLLTGALATGLQALVGIAVTSFYHPVFLGFNAAVLLLGYLAFRVFHRGARASAIALSDTKYRTAQWLETLARSNSFFKSQRAADWAIARTERVRDDYIRDHKRHFHFTFAQIVSFLVLYALVSATLLGVGGWLVIVGQLTIGQLVAAELILSAIFYGLTRMGYYLELYYDLFAAMYKLAQLFRIRPEGRETVSEFHSWQPDVVFDDVRVVRGTEEYRYDFAVDAGSKVMIETRSSRQVRAVTGFLLRHRVPDAGRVILGGHDAGDFPRRRLRDDVHIIDSALFPESSIAEYLAIANPGITRAQIRTLLSTVGLDTESANIDEILDVPLTSHGYPLSVAGVFKLKIAYALASMPRIIVLTPLFDTLSHEARVSIVDAMRARPDLTVLCFSHRRDLDAFDAYYLFDFDGQHRFDSLRELDSEHERRGLYNVALAAAETDA